MADDAAAWSRLSDGQDHLFWLRYLEVAGDQAMSVRLDAVGKAARAGRA